MTPRSVSAPPVSRRGFLHGAAAFAGSLALPVWAQEASAKTWVYVGCYTARGLGIYVYDMNLLTGELKQIRIVGDPVSVPNPSFLALEPQGRYLYSVNEIGNYQGRQSGSVTSFSVDYNTGNLTKMNVQPTEGRNPAFISLDPTGKFAMTANYSGTTTNTNSFTVLPINADGTLEPPSSIITNTGTLGPNTGRQEAPHGHQILPDPTGSWVIGNDLALDRSFIYRLDRQSGVLNASGNSIEAKAGAGPRHLAFHPNGKYLFILHELDNTVVSYNWDPERGNATFIQRISTLPDYYGGISTSAQIVASRDGRFVYSSNRGHDSIAIFSVDPATGKLTWVGEQWTFGETPRNFNIDPTGNYMHVAHQNTDNIVTFKVDKATGKLTFTGQLLTAGQPVCIIFHGPSTNAGNVKDGVTFHALRNPVLADNTGLGMATLAWNAPGANNLEIRIGAPNGVLMGSQANYGVASTGRWVSDGTMFYLQDVTGGKPLTAANTLGTVKVNVIL